MPNLFKAIIGIAAFHRSQSPNLASIDTSVDRLHYRFTAGILFLSTTLLGLNDIFGKPIMCKSQVKLSQSTKALKASCLILQDGDANDAIEQFCFVSGTYTSGNTGASSIDWLQ